MRSLLRTLTHVHIKSACIGLGLLGLSGWVSAAGTTGAEFLRTQAPATVSALGAGAGDARGEESINWNPAGLVGQPYESLALTHFSGLVDTAYEQIEGFVPEGFGGPWAARFFYVSTYNFTEVDALGEPVGAMENYDALLHVAHARALAPGLRAGAGLKVFESALAGFHSRGAALDAGLLFAPQPEGWSLGFCVNNLGAKTAFDREADALPFTAVLGLAWHWRPTLEQKVSVLGDLQCPLVGDDPVQPLLGLEYTLKDLIYLRGGYRWTDELGALSAGAGLHWLRWGVDYSFQPFGNLGSQHRFTLSYVWKPLPPPEPRVIPPPLSSAADPALPTEVRLNQVQDPDAKSLSTLPRDLDTLVVFKQNAYSAPEGGTLNVVNARGERVKHFTLTRESLTDIYWDGRDDAGQVISSAEHYAYRWDAAGPTQPAYALVQLNPVLKLVFEDGSLLEPQAEFEFAVRPETKSWMLRIIDKGSGEEVRSLQASLPLLKTWTWDGLNQVGALVLNRPEGLVYQLTAVYPHGQEVVTTAAIHGIKARRVQAQKGQNGLLIPEILFDFNSAVLKPEMLDKITAAAQVLKRHEGSAVAICEGHADEIGSQELNRKISVQRAYMVAKFMSETLQIPTTVLFVRGFGKNQPDAIGFSEEARARNRRVEIRILIERP